MPLVRRPVLLAVFSAAGLCWTGLYFQHYPIPGLLTRLGEVAAAAVFLAVSAGVGAGILPRVLGPRHAEELPPADLLIWSVGMGVPVLALALLGLGAAGFFSAGPFFILTAVAALAGGLPLDRALRRFRDSLRTTETSTFSLPQASLGTLAAAVLAVALLCALAPPTYYDSLVYHLALPAKYLQEGRVGFVPYNQYAHFPQNMEMVYAWFLALGNDVAAQVFNVALAALLAAALLRWARSLALGAGAGCGLFLFVSAPCTVLLSTETYVETALAFWTTLTLWAGARGILERKRRWLVAAGIMAGFAAGIKYTGVITPVLLGVFVLVWPRPRPWRDRAADFAALALPAFLVFLPWLAKNFVLTGGNPVFPFLPSIFPARHVYLSEQSARAYFRVLDEYKGSSSLLNELFGLPGRLLGDMLSFGGGFDVTGDLGWALPLILFPMALLASSASPAGRLLLAYAAAHILLWASMRPVLRFLFPLFPLLCLLSGQGLAALRAESPAWGRRAAGLLLALFLLSNGVLFYLVERVRDPFPAALGLTEREDYLRRKLDVYPALEFINQNLAADSRLLFVGEQRGYYCRRPYVAPMALLPQPLLAWADEAGEGGRLREKLLESGFTHVFFNRREAERIKNYGILDFTERGRAAWEGMLRAAPAVYDSGAAAVYDLRRHG